MTVQQHKLLVGLSKRWIVLADEGSDIFFKMHPFLEKDPDEIPSDKEELEKQYKQNNRETHRVNVALIKLLEEIYPTPKSDIVAELMGQTKMSVDK